MKSSKDTEERVVDSSGLRKGKAQGRPAGVVDNHAEHESLGKHLRDER